MLIAEKPIMERCWIGITRWGIGLLVAMLILAGCGTVAQETRQSNAADTAAQSQTTPSVKPEATAIAAVTPLPPTPAPTATLALTPTPANPAPELIGGGNWLNSEPLTLAELRGQVVLIDFWTYGCINCQRTRPHVRAWWDAYRDDGLVIIGVHTPEFESEKSLENVRAAVVEQGVTWPVVQDNEKQIWRAYENRYWPRFYLIDKQGNIIYDHIGEGRYEETERRIVEALAE